MIAMAKISNLPFRLKGSIQSVEEFIMLPMVINVCLNFKTATKIQNLFTEDLLERITSDKPHQGSFRKEDFFASYFFRLYILLDLYDSLVVLPNCSKYEDIKFCKLL